MRDAFVSKGGKGNSGQAPLPHFLTELGRGIQKSSALEDYRKKIDRIDRIVKKDSKTLGYRDYRGKYDNLPPLKNSSGNRRRDKMLARYSGLRNNAATAVKNYSKKGQLRRRRHQSKISKTRNRLSTGMCEICNIKMTKPVGEGVQPWHGESLEHIQEHDLGGTLRYNQVAVICEGCNKALAALKAATLSGNSGAPKKKTALYDYVIFKQVMLLSLKAATRDFNDDYIVFWQTRRDLANESHAKMLESLEVQEDRSAYQQTVYWTLECRFHSHCRECGACRSTIQSHQHGHNLTYIPD